MKTKVLSVIAAAVLAVTSFVAFAVTASAVSTVDLSTLTGNYTAQNGETLTGTLGGNYNITIADGATVTLKDVTINGVKNVDYKWAGITPLGDATIILEGENTVKGFAENYPGIYAAVGKTLTIRGTGSLTASSNGYGTGIGGGWKIACGNIVIEGGNITAMGGKEVAAIGGGREASCGNITITDGVTSVTAIKGDDVNARVIGYGFMGSCGKITIGGEVISSTITKSPYIYPTTVDLSKLTGNYTARDGVTLTGTLGGNCKITIADGATVTLHNAVIDRYKVDPVGASWCEWAGITPLGNATIVLEGANTVKGFNASYPGVFAAVGKTLTISGSGSLTAASNGFAPGIGGAGKADCGNIIINGGNIITTGGIEAAGIGGGGRDVSCGSITISGGTVTATGGNNAAGIGSGYMGTCGNITITDGVTSVTAIKGGVNAASIGAGFSGNCGTVTIGDDVITEKISISPYTYPDQTATVTGAVTDIMANHEGNDEGAMAFITTLTKRGTGDVTVGSITWSITAEGTTKSHTASGDKLPVITFGGNGAEAIIALAVNNLYDLKATAEVHVD